ncbi:MAG: nucleotidyltransferase [Geobacteraceae bacterium]|nr:nucleotidyltransferase [Geobacteraceae bacterium]
MTTKEQKRLLLENMVSLLELPVSAYQKAKDRYEDIGSWLGRDESICNNNDPHIFPQGSFRLGTAIRPLIEDEAYDLDLACKLRAQITKKSHSQESLKVLVGLEIESYRIARGIKAPKDEKHRCWRLEYQDTLSFHMDITPCISADDARQQLIFEALRKSGEDEYFSQGTSHLTVSITDNRHPEYRQISENWHISNPEGYAKWFESRMNLSLLTILEKAQVDEIPIYQRKTPLQRVVQLLKRHRDLMFKDDPEVKPISIILTTLAARAYNGETDIESALTSILSRMGSYVNAAKPRVPNPVDPAEDFADKWSRPECNHLKLEQNFWFWLQQAQTDIELLCSSDDAGFISEQASKKFSVRMNTSEISKSLGLALGPSIIVPRTHDIESTPPKPWGQEK